MVDWKESFELSNKRLSIDKLPKYMEVSEEDKTWVKSQIEKYKFDDNDVAKQLVNSLNTKCQ